MLDDTQNLLEAEYREEPAVRRRRSAGAPDPYSPFDEPTEMESAAELLTVNGEVELGRFLGRLFRKAARGSRSGGLGGRRRFSRSAPWFRSALWRHVGRRLRDVARKALPLTGGVHGRARSTASSDGLLGSSLTGAAGRLFGLELEGLSPEDQEFEVARRFVRLAGEAAVVATATPPHVPPRRAARRALMMAARKHAPGLLRRRQPLRTPSTAEGRWKRSGRTLVLYDA